MIMDFFKKYLDGKMNMFLRSMQERIRVKPFYTNSSSI